MGLGLRAVAKLPESDAIGSPLELISNAAGELASSRGLKDFFRSRQRGGLVQLSFHPAAEDVNAEILEGGNLVVSAKTSGAGPGYHQFIVELTDRIAGQLGTDWAWSDSDEASFDETGYAVTRDFARLQDEMVAMFRALADTVVERPGVHLVNMPLDYGVLLNDDVATPLGPFPRQFFEGVVRDRIKAIDAARQFYPWWESGLTAATWKNLGLTSLWMDVHWRPPHDDEREEIARTIACFDRAKELDPRLSFPDAEIAELRRLLEVEYADPPEEQRIGYRRRDWRRELTGGWSVVVPGFFFDRWEDDDTTIVYWYGEREVWGTTWKLKSAREATLDDIKSKMRPDSFVVNHDGIVGCANKRTKSSGDGTYLVVSCDFQGFGSTAVLTIVVPDESQISWARRVFESVRFRRQGA
jgi:hypothetical protein